MDSGYSHHYSRFHSPTDAHYEEMRKYYRALLKPLLGEYPQDSQILDVGCGIGLLVSALLKDGFENASGVDLSATQIAIAQKRGLPCSIIGSEEIYDLADKEADTHDVVFLMDVLEHISVHDQIRFLQAMWKLLKPTGSLILTVPNANSAMAARYRYIDWTHTSAFTEHSLEFVLSSAGFRSTRFLPYLTAAPVGFPFVHKGRFWTGALRMIVRGFRRLEALGELGRQGMHIPLDLNLYVAAKKI